MEKGDYEATSSEKTSIEVAQRELRKKEKEEGIEWQRKYFSKVESEERFEKLASKVGIQPEIEKTGGGIWVFDEEKLKKADEAEAKPE